MKHVVSGSNSDLACHSLTEGTLHSQHRRPSSLSQWHPSHVSPPRVVFRKYMQAVTQRVSKTTDGLLRTSVVGDHVQLSFCLSILSRTLSDLKGHRFSARSNSTPREREPPGEWSQRIRSGTRKSILWLKLWSRLLAKSVTEVMFFAWLVDGTSCSSIISKYRILFVRNQRFLDCKNSASALYMYSKMVLWVLEKYERKVH